MPFRNLMEGGIPDIGRISWAPNTRSSVDFRTFQSLFKHKLNAFYVLLREYYPSSTVSSWGLNVLRRIEPFLIPFITLLVFLPLRSYLPTTVLWVVSLIYNWICLLLRRQTRHAHGDARLRLFVHSSPVPPTRVLNILIAFPRGR